MLERDRVLAELDELDSYLAELRGIAPRSYEEYVNNAEKKRACERLLHISIECLIDICALLVRGLRLGLPAEEGDLFNKLEAARVITGDMRDRLKAMRGFRNILVHRYGEVDNELTFENLSRLDDFEEFRRQITAFIRSL